MISGKIAGTVIVLAFFVLMSVRVMRTEAHAFSWILGAACAIAVGLLVALVFGLCRS